MSTFMKKKELGSDEMKLATTAACFRAMHSFAYHTSLRS